MQYNQVNVWREGLQKASELGLAPPDVQFYDQGDRSSCSRKYTDVIAACQQHHELRRVLAQHVAHEQTQSLTCRDLQQRRAQGLRRASLVLKDLMHNMPNIESRLRANTTKVTVPIERQHQDKFQQLLRSACSDPDMLRSCSKHTDWLAAHQLSPASWEESLQLMQAAVETCQELKATMQEHHQALERASQL